MALFSALTFLLLLFTLVATQCSCSNTTSGVSPLVPSSTEMKIYDPVRAFHPMPNAYCTDTTYAFSMSISSEVCTGICYGALTIASAPENDCQFTLWSDSTTCGVTG